MYDLKILLEILKIVSLNYVTRKNVFIFNNLYAVLVIY